MLDFAYFEEIHTNFVIVDADSRAVQQIIFTGKANSGVMIYYIFKKSKEAMLELSKRTAKNSVISING